MNKAETNDCILQALLYALAVFYDACSCKECGPCLYQPELRKAIALRKRELAALRRMNRHLEAVNKRAENSKLTGN